MKIILTNNKSKIEGPAKLLIKLRNNPLFAIRAKGAFFSRAFQTRQWDGFIRFISERGYLDTGKVPQLVRVLKELDEEVDIIDQREGHIKAEDIPRRIGKFESRKYQFEALKSIKYNKLEGLSFPRGVIGAATNAGKTYISCALYKMYNQPTLFLINSKELLEQALEEIPQIIPGKVGYLASSVGEKWNDFMIVMVQTAVARLDRVGNKLLKYKVVLVDECDLATSASYKKLLGYTFNSFVRVGLSGSAYSDPRKKEKNEKLRGIFGEELFKITNKNLMEQGYSSWVRVTMMNGNTIYKEDDFNEEYTRGIIKSKERNRKVVKRVKHHYKQKRLPILVIVKNHKHVELLYKRLMKEESLKDLKISWVHHKRKDRKVVVRKFKDGAVDVLVGSYILKRGKNFPLMKAIINAGGGDSIANVLQILGRATRTHEDKDYTYMDDFYDKGTYIRSHSLHRFQTYKNEGLQILDKVDKKLL